MMVPRVRWRCILALGGAINWISTPPSDAAPDQRDALHDLWGIRTSRDEGQTWSAFLPYFKLAPALHPYPVWLARRDQESLDAHLFWLVHSRAGGWTDIRYLRSSGGRAWTSSRPDTIQLPIEDPTVGDLVYEGQVHGFQNDAVVDASGRPLLLFVTGGGAIADDNRALVAVQRDEGWRVREVVRATSRYNRGVLRSSAPGHLEVFFASGTLAGGTIGVWGTTDHGEEWAFIGEIDTPGEAANPARVRNAHPELQVLWCGGEAGRSIFGWGETGTLPAR